MGRGVRTVTQGYGKSIFDVPDVKPVVQNEPEKRNISRKHIVGTGVDEESIIRLDRNGDVLVFEQTDKFLPLSDGTLAVLTRENKLRYTMAKEFHDAWRGDEHSALVEKFQVDRQMVGSATDKLKIQGPDDMEIRWRRPDEIESARAEGWKVLDSDEAKSYLGPKGGHHEIGKLGQTELVAVGIPKAIFDKRDQERVRRRNEQAGAWRSQGLNEINRQGGKGFVAVDSDKRQWSETLPDGSGEV